MKNPKIVVTDNREGYFFKRADYLKSKCRSEDIKYLIDQLANKHRESLDRLAQ